MLRRPGRVALGAVLPVLPQRLFAQRQRMDPRLGHGPGRPFRHRRAHDGRARAGVVCRGGQRHPPLTTARGSSIFPTTCFRPRSPPPTAWTPPCSTTCRAGKRPAARRFSTGCGAAARSTCCPTPPDTKPVFADELAPLNSPLDTLRIGNGKVVHHHGSPADLLRDNAFLAAEPPAPTLVKGTRT